MISSITRTVCAVLATLPLLASDGLAQTTVNLTSVKDNTLYEHPTGLLSNGKGSRMFSGIAGIGTARRGLVEFDVAGSVPAGVVITEAKLTLQVVMSLPGTKLDVSLHKMSEEWGEADEPGSSAGMGQGGGAVAQPGDATWLENFSGTSSWSSPGAQGDFNPVPSATLEIDLNGSYTWPSTTGLNSTVADVQGWLDDRSSNHGWMLKSPEAVTGAAKAFATKDEMSVPAFRPSLEITYTVPVPFPEFGMGCPGSVGGGAGAGGFTPTLTGLGPATPGSSISLTVAQGLGGSSALVFIGLAEAALPVGFGCTLNCFPLVGAPISVPLFGVGPGNGSITLNPVIPVGTPPGTVRLQAFCIDNGVPLGASATNGLTLTIP